MKTFFSLLVLLFPGFALAQDPVFSQFYANKPLLNPALTALDEGTAVTINHRNLWRRIPGGFRTFAAAAETQWASCAKGKSKLHAPFFNFGYGLVAQHDEEGEGLLQTNELHASASAYHLIRENAAWHIGVSVGGGQKNIDFSRLIFSDQLNAIRGKVLSVTAAPIDLEKRSFAELGAGAALRFGHQFGISEGFQSIGFSVRHALLRVESLDRGGGARLPPIFTLHYGSALPVWVDHEGSKKYFVYWSPQFQAVWQGRFGVIGYGFYGLYRGAMGGVFLRHPVGARPDGRGGHTQTMMFTGGFEVPFAGSNLLRLDYSYDMNVGGLAPYGAGGAHEISLKINMFGRSPGGCKVSGGKEGARRKGPKCPAWPGSQSRRF